MTGCVVIGCDNAAVPMKDILKRSIEEMGIAVEDMGVSSEADQLPYALTAKAVCDRIIDSGYEKRGVLICGTGIGMCMTANKFKGIRAAVGHDIFSAQRSVLSNNGNVICFGARKDDFKGVAEAGLYRRSLHPEDKGNHEFGNSEFPLKNPLERRYGKCRKNCISVQIQRCIRPYARPLPF